MIWTTLDPASLLQTCLAITELLAAAVHLCSGPVDLCIQVLQDCTLIGDTLPCLPCGHHQFPDRLPAGRIPLLLLPDTPKLSAVAACFTAPANGRDS